MNGKARSVQLRLCGFKLPAQAAAIEVHGIGRAPVKRAVRSARIVQLDVAMLALRERIVMLAHTHRRYGSEMIYLKLRQAGQCVNRKRVGRLYALEKLQIRRRRRKKVLWSSVTALLRPQAANDVWSMDFVFAHVEF